VKKPAPLPEERCKRTRCIRRAVHEGLCLRHAMKKPLLNATRGNSGSGPEKDRRAELQVLAQVGAIKDLREQVPYPFVWNGVHLTSWKADFVYFDVAAGEVVVEDTKAGLVSDRHVLCMRLMRAAYGITVRELDMRTGKARGRKVRRIR
jgi:hypothetical protein